MLRAHAVQSWRVLRVAFIVTTAALTLACGASDGDSTFDAGPVSEFNQAYCDEVAGTLNVHWEAVAGSAAPCTGIEITDGDVAEAIATGSVSINGLAVSDVACIGTGSYNLVLSADTLSLVGSDTQSEIDMRLTRLPSEACFVGHWVEGGDDYVGHISAAAFGVFP